MLSKRENFLKENLVFWGGNLWALLEARFIHLFEISAKIVVLLISLADNFKEIFIFSTLIRGSATLEDKRSNSIFSKNVFFIN